MDEALFCTVSYVDAEGRPVTIPTNFVRVGEAVVIHGKSNNALIRAAAGGAPLCFTFTLVGAPPPPAAPTLQQNVTAAGA